MKKILFIGHDANRAGAQIVLLHLMKQLRQHGYQMHLLLGNGGELMQEYGEIASVAILPQTNSTHKKGFIKRILGLLRLKASLEKRHLSRFRQYLESHHFDLIFVNTIASAKYFRQIDDLQLPVVMFAHELEMSIQKYCTPDDLTYLMGRTHHLMAVSKAVADYYHNTYDYPLAQISTLQIIDIPSILNKLSDAKKTNIRQQHGLPPDAILVGGCGHAEWRKGNDVFMFLAQEVIKKAKDKPVYFVWVGMKPDTEWYQIQRFDAKRLGLSDKIIHVNLTENVFSYLSQLDIFVLTSREDPYPLVVLEAALAQKPIVCFDQSGGAPELVEDDAGFVVPYLDIIQMTEKVLQLIEKPDLCSIMGDRAYEKVLLRHEINTNVERVIKIIEKIPNKPNL
ncbi:MAG: glycosyltransferase family 4 protein [Runella sp.]